MVAEIAGLNSPVHDLLFALVGVSGDVFQLVGNTASNSGGCGFSCRHLELKWLHAGEQAAARELVEAFGCPFRSMQVWVAAHSRAVDTPVYLQSVAHSLKRIMSKYSDCVADLERLYLADPASDHSAVLSKRSPLAEIAIQLAPHREFMGKISEFLTRLSQIDSSVAVFQVASDFSLAETDENGPFHSIYGSLLRAFASQLSAWIRNGPVYDPHREFFIQIDSDGRWSLVDACRPYIVSKDVGDQLFRAGRQLRNTCSERMIGYLEECSNRLVLLLTPSFHRTEFEIWALDVVKFTCRHVRNYLMDKLFLRNHMNRLRGVFLLADAELFEEFITLKLQFKAPVKFHDMNRLLYQATLKTGDEAIVQRFSFFDNVNSNTISLKYKLASDEQALFAIITDKDIAGLDEMFWILLRIKESQMKLHCTWKEAPTSIIMDFSILKYHLNVILSSIWSFLQEVIQEVHEKSLLDDDGDVTDFISDEYLFRRYTHPMLTKSLLRVTAIKDTIVGICEISNSFTDALISQNPLGNSEIKSMHKELLDKLSFLTRSGEAINTIRTTGGLSSVEKLLLKLTFNTASN